MKQAFGYFVKHSLHNLNSLLTNKIGWVCYVIKMDTVIRSLLLNRRRTIYCEPLVVSKYILSPLFIVDLFLWLLYENNLRVIIGFNRELFESKTLKKKAFYSKRFLIQHNFYSIRKIKTYLFNYVHFVATIRVQDMNFRVRWVSVFVCVCLCVFVCVYVCVCVWKKERDRNRQSGR